MDMQEYTVCPVCKKVIEDLSQAVACTECGAVYHSDCWQNNYGCATPGCSMNKMEQQAAYSGDADAQTDAAAQTQPQPQPQGGNEQYAAQTPDSGSYGAYNNQPVSQTNAVVTLDQANSFVELCSKCGAPLPPDSDFCSKCGTRKGGDKKTCSACGMLMNKSEKFCPSCGKVQKGSKGKTIGIIAAVVAVVAIVAVVAVVLLIPPKVEKLTVPNTQITVYENDNAAIEFTVEPEKAIKRGAEWSVSDEKIAKVEDGKLTGVAAGECEVTLTIGDKSEKIKVTVVPHVETISLKADSAKIKKDESTQLKCTITPEGAADTVVEWSSSNEAVATVDPFGYVVAKDKGETTITATADGKSSTVSITVTTGPDFKAVYDQVNGDGYYVKVANDGSYLIVDTNPADSSYAEYTSALKYSEYVVPINRALNLPASLDEKMSNTTALDGRQTDTYGDLKVSWKYHPDYGMEITYEINE